MMSFFDDEYGKCRRPTFALRPNKKKMSEQRLSLWNAEEDLEEVVDLSIAIGNYGPNVYDDGLPALSFKVFFYTVKNSSAYPTTSD